MNRENRYTPKHRAIENLKLLKKEELKTFGKWLNSNWSNTIKNLPKLFETLKLHYPHFNHPKLAKEQLYQRLYPNKDYHDKDYLNLMSKLSRAVEDFLIHSHIQNNKQLKEELRLRVINERRSKDSRKEKLLDLNLKAINKKAVKDTSDYLRLVNLHGLHFKLNHPNKSLASKKDDLIAIDENLDHFYALSKARNLMEYHELKILLGEKRIQTENEIFELGTKVPATRFYKSYLEQGDQIEKDQFIFLQKIFLNHVDEMDKVDQRNIYLILINLSARLKQAGNDEILQETLLLNKLASEKGFILDNNQITSHSFANIITTACSRQDFDFAQRFLTKYIQYLPLSIQKDAKDWGNLKINYTQATENVVALANNLNDHNRTHTVFSLRIRVLITQIFFDAYHRDENEMDDKFTYYIEAFEKKLEREEKYPEKQLIGLKTFNRYAKKLASFLRNQDYEVQDLLSIKTQINQEENIHAKSWLEEKIEQIKQGVSA